MHFILQPRLLWLLVFIIGTTGFQVLHTNKADDLTGAWQRQNGDETHMLLLVDGYLTYTTYRQAGKQFIQTAGGPYMAANNQLRVQYEFDTQNDNKIGQASAYAFSVSGQQLTTTINGQKAEWKRIDNGRAPLAGVWHITSRMQEGQLVPIHRSGTRKTLKILTGNRFQWVAIDPGAKQFSGTGGGTYTFANGTYTEHIEFFSRDSSRVGASLSFEGKLQNGDWHHSGLSSKGDKIYEVWSKVKG